MNDKLPRITAGDAIRALQKAGFFLVRQSGKHKIYKNAAGNRVTVPHHLSQVLHPKVLRNILQDADLTVEEFKELL